MKQLYLTPEKSPWEQMVSAIKQPSPEQIAQWKKELICECGHDIEPPRFEGMVNACRNDNCKTKWWNR